MKIFTIICLLLYGSLNLIIGIVDLTTERTLTVFVDVALILTGSILFISGILIGWNSIYAFRAALFGLFLAMALAVF